MIAFALLLSVSAALAAAEPAGFDLDRYQPVRTVAVSNVPDVSLEAALARAEPGDRIDVAPWR